MTAPAYHHGNLKNALIDAGIELFNEVGYDNLSLRKVAAKCGVSHAAPYSHFKSKEELIDKMKDHASNRFADSLEQSIADRGASSLQEQVILLAKAYVSFFIENPRYYTFIFEQADFDINLDDVRAENGFRAFEIFRKLSIAYIEQTSIPEPAYQQAVIKMWALVHGIAGIAIMNGIKFSCDWSQITEQIISNG